MWPRFLQLNPHCYSNLFQQPGQVVTTVRVGDGATGLDEGGSQGVTQRYATPCKATQRLATRQCSNLPYSFGSLAKVVLAGSVGIAFGIFVYCLRKRRAKHRPRADRIGCISYVVPMADVLVIV